MKKVIIINGSPRKRGFCSRIRNTVCNELEYKGIEYEVYNLGELNMEFCTACGACSKTGYCVKKDDISDLYDGKFDKADGAIVISPVYFDALPAQVKLLIDRSQALFASKYHLGKPSIDRSKKRLGMGILVGGSSSYNYQFTGARHTLEFFGKSINTKMKRIKTYANTDKIEYDGEMEENVKLLMSGYIEMLLTGKDELQLKPILKEDVPQIKLPTPDISVYMNRDYIIKPKNSGICNMNDEIRDLIKKNKK